MTAKYNVVLNDPTEVLAARLNEATEVLARVNDATESMATNISHATERLATRCLEMLNTAAVDDRPAQAWSLSRPESEAWPGWGQRMVPSLIITAWFGLVFVILALTAPPAQVEKTVNRPAATSTARPVNLHPSISIAD